MRFQMPITICPTCGDLCAACGRLTCHCGEHGPDSFPPKAPPKAPNLATNTFFPGPRRDPNGFVWNGFDYALQVWVIAGIVQRCGHGPEMRRGASCCNGFRWAGAPVATVPGAEVEP